MIVLYFFFTATPTCSVLLSFKAQLSQVIGARKNLVVAQFLFKIGVSGLAFSHFLNFWHLTWHFSRESYFVHSKGSKALALTFIWDTLYKNIIRGFSWRFFVRSPLRSTIVCPFVWCLSDFSYQVLGRKFLTNQEDLKNCSCCPLIFVHGGNDESTISFDDSN